MTRNEQEDIPDRLRNLRKTTAPAHFEDRLYQEIRSQHSRNRFAGWLIRPIPVTLVLTVGALLIVFFFVSPRYLSSPPVPGSGNIGVQSQGQTGQSPRQRIPGTGQASPSMVSDSLSVDSALVRKNDVNTSKMP